MIAQTAMPPYPWQQQIWASFCQNLDSGRLPHAILVSGADGLGLEELGAAMVRLLLCQTPLEDVACGRCKACTLLAAGSHPDFFVLKPEEGAKQIKVDQVRDCVNFVAKTSHFDGPKVVLVEQAESMNVNAANALLKSLEEPVGSCVFILVSARINAILPTIRSRCQSMTVALPPQSEALAWLDDNKVTQALLWLRQAGGAPLKARDWASGDFAAAQLKLWNDLSSMLVGRQSSVALAASWQSMDLVELIQMQQFLIETLIRSTMSTEECPAELETLSRGFAALDQSYLFRFHDKLLKRLSLAQGSANLNVQLQCEEMAMDWHSVCSLANRAR